MIDAIRKAIPNALIMKEFVLCLLIIIIKIQQNPKKIEPVQTSVEIIIAADNLSVDLKLVSFNNLIKQMKMIVIRNISAA
jgi:hypothetical protein